MRKAVEEEEVNLDAPRRQVHCLGHGAAEARFLDAYNRDRLHHAWLLHGPKGVGKATFAFRAARFLLADEKSEAGGLFGGSASPETMDRPADDPGCRRVTAGSHSDLFTAEPEKPGRQILAETARDLVQFFHLTAGEGAWRVAIIDAADELHRTSANILLKLIEEPPPRSIILIVSHNPGRLLPTIRSRCARLGFDPIRDESVARILSERRPEAQSDDIAAAVKLAGGAPGRALSLLDGGGADVVLGLAKALDGRRGEGTLTAEAYAQSIAKNAFHREIAGETLLAWFATAARPPDATPAPGLTPDLTRMATTAAKLGPKPWLDLHRHATVRLERARAVNLDPAQTLVDILARAQALLARASA